jgi:hypothetical protein
LDAVNRTRDGSDAGKSRLALLAGGVTRVASGLLLGKKSDDLVGFLALLSLGLCLLCGLLGSFALGLGSSRGLLLSPKALARGLVRCEKS